MKTNFSKKDDTQLFLLINLYKKDYPVRLEVTYLIVRTGKTHTFLIDVIKAKFSIEDSYDSIERIRYVQIMILLGELEADIYFLKLFLEAQCF